MALNTSLVMRAKLLMFDDVRKVYVYVAYVTGPRFNLYEKFLINIYFCCILIRHLLSRATWRHILKCQLLFNISISFEEQSSIKRSNKRDQ